MKETDLYLSVYRNLEDEVLTIAKYIHCDSHQKSVYSMSIADLIVRCSVEIEAISKILYKNLGGNMTPKDDAGNDRYLYFDTDCLALIDKNYGIAKKKVVVSTAAFYLDDSDRIIRPLKESHKMGQGNGCKWKDAYQALKHDRYGSLAQYGNVYNMLHALAALFILNIYLRDEVFKLPDGRFDERLDSKIFSVIVYKADNVSINIDGFSDDNINKPKDTKLEESLYILKLSDADARALYDAYIEDNKESINRLQNSPAITKFLSEHPDYEIKNAISLIQDAEGTEAIRKYIVAHRIGKQFLVKNREAIVNKGTTIYPTITG